MNNIIISQLSNILSTYQSIVAFFYQKITQTKFTNNNLATYQINYNLLLPGSEYLLFINEAQVSAQIQAYIDLCDILVAYISLHTITQVNLFYEQIQNQLNASIAQLNGFSLSLLKAQYNTLFTYKTTYAMSLSEALYINNLSQISYARQASLNYNLTDFNNIQQNTILVLSK